MIVLKTVVTGSSIICGQVFGKLILHEWKKLIFKAVNWAAIIIYNALVGNYRSGNMVAKT